MSCVSMFSTCEACTVSDICEATVLYSMPSFFASASKQGWSPFCQRIWS